MESLRTYNPNAGKNLMGSKRKRKKKRPFSMERWIEQKRIERERSGIDATTRCHAKCRDGRQCGNHGVAEYKGRWVCEIHLRMLESGNL